MATVSMYVPAAGALGPRLAGRLTAELILRSPQYMSCIKLYHLDLRGVLHAFIRICERSADLHNVASARFALAS